MSTPKYGAGRVAVSALAVVLLLSGCTAPAPAAGATYYPPPHRFE